MLPRNDLHFLLVFDDRGILLIRYQKSPGLLTGVVSPRYSGIHGWF